MLFVLEERKVVQICLEYNLDVATRSEMQAKLRTMEQRSGIYKEQLRLVVDFQARNGSFRK